MVGVFSYLKLIIKASTITQKTGEIENIDSKETRKLLFH